MMNASLRQSAVRRRQDDLSCSSRFYLLLFGLSACGMIRDWPNFKHIGYLRMSEPSQICCPSLLTFSLVSPGFQMAHMHFRLLLSLEFGWECLLHSQQCRLVANLNLGHLKASLVQHAGPGYRLFSYLALDQVSFIRLTRAHQYVLLGYDL